ncbi:MAG: PH domain-containing protein [Candidatus ainarchaeum sp.]|nr:PH domain-containing protein [Candidatus ainarchaeum sp.]
MEMIKPTPSGFFMKKYWHLLVFLIFITILNILSLLGSFSLGWILFIIFGISVLSVFSGWVHSKLHSEATLLSITDDELVHQTGILSMQKKKIPVHKITDSSIRRSFYDKILNLCSINFSTSGSTGYEISIIAMPYNEAELFHDELHRLIRTRMKRPVEKNSPENILEE